MKNTWMAVAGAVFVGVLAWGKSEDLIDGYTNASWILPHWTRFDRMDDFLSLRGYTQIFTKRSFDINPNAEYEVSGLFRTPAGSTQQSRFEFGLDLLDAEGNVIPPHAVMNMPGTYSTLVQPLAVGDREMFLAKTKGRWLYGQYVAMNAKADYADLPNHELIAFKTINMKQDTMILQLAKPAEKAYPKGTAVRNHVRLRFWINRSGKAPMEWKRFSGRIRGYSKDGHGVKHWWPSAAKARVFLMLGKNVPLDFKDVDVKEILDEK